MTEDNRQDNRPQVRILAESAFDSKTQFVMAYEPVKDANGVVQVDHTGAILNLHRLGGVKVGSMGRLAGPAARAPRALLAGYEKVPSIGTDYVDMVPVYLEEYQKYAWFPSTNAKVVG